MFKKLKEIGCFFTCERYTELSSRSLDEPLSLVNKIGFWLHHVICTFCRRTNRQFKVIERVAQDIDDNEGLTCCKNLSLSSESKERIKSNMKQ